MPRQSGHDPNAIHKQTPQEINSIPLKVTPVAADVIVSEDSADGFKKKKITLTDLLGGGGGGAGVKIGTYVGDGTISQAITGVGFLPSFVRVWDRETVTNSVVAIFETTPDIMDDNVNGGCVRSSETQVRFRDRRMISLDPDGFTVDDNGTDEHPNKDGQIYNYLAIGASSGGGSDTTAIHDDVAAEISAIAEKLHPQEGDFVVIEDEADGFAKKKVNIAALPISSSQGVSEAQTNSTIVAFTQKLRETIVVVAPDSAFLVMYSCELQSTDAGTQVKARVQLDDGAPDLAAVDCSPQEGDFVVIEDEADGFAKKKVNIAALPISSSQGVSEAQTNSTIVAFTQKLRETIVVVAPDSAFLVMYSCELQSTDAGTQVKARVQLDDGAPDLAAVQLDPSVVAAGWQPFSGHAQVGLAPGAHTFDLDFASSQAGETVSIRNARIIVVKMSSNQ